jgi:MtaA/CmuA family methyltransferase
MERVGSFWPEAHYDPVQLSGLALAGHEILGFSSARIPFDLCLEAEAFGCTIKKGAPNNQPAVDKPAFEDYGAFEVPEDIWQRGRFQTVFRASDILMSKVGDRLPVFPMVVGPVTLTGYLFGLERALMDIHLRPEAYSKVLRQVANFTIQYANLLLEHANGTIVMADPVASGDLVSPKQFAGFYLPVYKEMDAGIKGKVILHICGNTTGMLAEVAQTGFDCFSFQGPEVQVSRAKEIVAGKIALAGNVPTLKHILQGTPDDVKRWSLQALEDGVHLLAPSCGLPPIAKISNIRPMAEAVEEFNARLK